MAATEAPEPAQLMARMRQERLRQELTLEWVATKVGVKHASISEFESGRKKPKDETLRKWLRALQLPDEWAEAWIEYQIEQDVRDVLERRRGPRAMAKEDVDAITRMVRRSWGRA